MPLRHRLGLEEVARTASGALQVEILTGRIRRVAGGDPDWPVDVDGAGRRELFGLAAGEHEPAERGDLVAQAHVSEGVHPMRLIGLTALRKGLLVEACLAALQVSNRRDWNEREARANTAGWCDLACCKKDLEKTKVGVTFHWAARPQPAGKQRCSEW